MRWFDEQLELALESVHVVDQLVDHFMDLGKLTTDDIKSLVKQGFITPENFSRYLAKYSGKRDHPIHNVLPRKDAATKAQEYGSVESWKQKFGDELSLRDLRSWIP